MARLLIHTAEAPLHPTDEKVNAGMFLPGHVVTIIEDWESFGDDENAPHVTVFEATGTPKKDLVHLVEDQTIDVQKSRINPDTKEEEIFFEAEQVAARMWRVKSVSQFKVASGLTRISKGAEQAFTQSYFEKTVDIAAVADERRAKGEVVR